MEIDALIVGQGLAGSLLAWEWQELGGSVVVVDDGHRSAASTVAVGTVNPITGQRLTLDAQFELYLRAMRRCFASIERWAGRQLYFDGTVVRYFQNDAERRRWQQRREQGSYRRYLPAVEAGGTGYFLIQGGGYCDCLALMSCVAQRLRSRARLLCEPFRHDELRLGSGNHPVRWQGYRARWVVFCEGYRWAENPWFHWLPGQPAKGEVLTVQSAEPEQGSIYQMQGKYLLPLADGSWRAGSTYTWDFADTSPTAAGRMEIVEALGPLLERMALKVTGAVAGVRPVSRDRQPLVGLHPQQPSVGIFNGFGAKGVLRIPYYAQLLLKLLQSRSVQSASLKSDATDTVIDRRLDSEFEA